VTFVRDIVDNFLIFSGNDLLFQGRRSVYINAWVVIYEGLRAFHPSIPGKHLIKPNRVNLGLFAKIRVGHVNLNQRGRVLWSCGRDSKTCQPGHKGKLTHNTYAPVVDKAMRLPGYTMTVVKNV